MKSVFIILLLLNCHLVFSQDTIKLNTNETIIVKIKELKKKGPVKFKPFSNLSGPICTLNKDQIKSIVYSDGGIETFSKNKQFGEMPEDSSFYLKTKKHNTVYIESDNEHAIIHAKNALENWQYWKITTNRSKADYILIFYVRHTLETYCYAEFIDPASNKVLYRTKEKSSAGLPDLNCKRAAVNSLIFNVIKPIYNPLLY